MIIESIIGCMLSVSTSQSIVFSEGSKSEGKGLDKITFVCYPRTQISNESELIPWASFVSLPVSLGEFQRWRQAE